MRNKNYKIRKKNNSFLIKSVYKKQLTHNNISEKEIRL